MPAFRSVGIPARSVDRPVEMNIATVTAKGYVFQVEMAWRAHQAGAVIAELPIHFRDRIHGRSKLGWPTIFEAIKELNKQDGLTVFLVEQNAFHALRLAHFLRPGQWPTDHRNRAAQHHFRVLAHLP